MQFKPLHMSLVPISFSVFEEKNKGIVITMVMVLLLSSLSLSAMQKLQVITDERWQPLAVLLFVISFELT